MTGHHRADPCRQIYLPSADQIHTTLIIELSCTEIGFDVERCSMLKAAHVEEMYTSAASGNVICTALHAHGIAVPMWLTFAA